MKKTQQGRKEASHERILEAAARAIRRSGYAPPEDALRTLVKVYLARLHVERAETGCPIAALGSEMPRQAPEVRRAATRRINEFIDLVGRHSPNWGQSGGHEHALATTATMVGALVLARGR
jgi:hypothetical protein